MTTQRQLDLDALVLQSGSHASPDVGMCVMEAVSYFAGEPHSAAPACACPSLTRYMIRLNDRLTSDERQLLKPFIPLLVGTRDQHSGERARVLAWAAVTKFAPTALRSAATRLPVDKAAALERHAFILETVPRYDWVAAQAAAKEARSAAAAYAAYAADAAAAYAAYDAAAYAAYAAADAADAAYAAHAAYAAADAAAAYAAGGSAADRAAARQPAIALAIAALKEALAVGKPAA